MLKRLLATFAFLALIGAPAFAGELEFYIRQYGAGDIGERRRGAVPFQC